MKAHVHEATLRHWRSIAEAMGSARACDRKEIIPLADMMGDAEDAVALTTGTHRGRSWLVATTHHRIVLVSARFMRSPEVLAIPLTDVQAVRGTTSWSGGSVLVLSRTGDITLKRVPADSVAPFVEKTTSMAREAQIEMTKLRKTGSDISRNLAEFIVNTL
jgi:hypothetical protein